MIGSLLIIFEKVLSLCCKDCFFFFLMIGSLLIIFESNSLITILSVDFLKLQYRAGLILVSKGHIDICHLSCIHICI